MARATLEHYGYHVVEAASGENAVGIFRRAKPPISTR